jgi:hypothetical protein
VSGHHPGSPHDTIPTESQPCQRGCHRAAPAQPPPNDAVARQGSQLSLRPVWQAIPRLASYGMVGFILTIIPFR